MANCDICGIMIDSGGIRLGDRVFCGRSCLDEARRLEPPPAAPARGFAHEIHSGPCPKCQGPGPVDVHETHWVWSALAFTRWGSRQQVSCRSCGVKSQLVGIAQSAVLGWWGFPWGFIVTPIQIVRNAVAILRPPSPDEPSERLRAVARQYRDD